MPMIPWVPSPCGGAAHSSPSSVSKGARSLRDSTTHLPLLPGRLMNTIRRYWPWLMLILVAHVTEQLLFGIDELYELKGQLGTVLGLFPNPDYGVVTMVGVVVLLV